MSHYSCKKCNLRYDDCKCPPSVISKKNEYLIDEIEYMVLTFDEYAKKYGKVWACTQTSYPTVERAKKDLITSLRREIVERREEIQTMEDRLIALESSK